MAGLLFVSQAMLDSWAGQGKIDLVGDVMHVLAGAGKGRSYALDPAVRFLEVLGADADPNQLLRKVKTTAQLKALGAEAVDDSVVLGDVAYEVEPGFLAEASALEAAATAQAAAPAAPRPAGRAPAAPAAPAVPPAGAPAPPAAKPRAEELEARRKEAEALARFLLRNLS
jgi:pyruvate/2-oxoglutarate dehydrogenase complex dihydrolipoamide acyltransferase (E2) component